jgi:hypothetical protein
VTRSSKASELDFGLITGAVIIILCISSAAIFAMKAQDREETPLANSATNTVSKTIGSAGVSEVNREVQR